MAADEANVAAAALAIAVVAFVIACCQLLQQLFGTADGYRRCQQSIIGEWSTLVKLRLRWSSLRIEVRVTTPHFEICSLTDAEEVDKPNRLLSEPKRRIAITGSDASRRGTFCRTTTLNEEENEDEDAVSWTSLLASLHTRQQLLLVPAQHSWRPDSVSRRLLNNHKLLRQTQITAGNPAIVCIRLKTRSWDLMPPDVVRPVASTTLGTVISLAHRLGMIWRDLVPREGKLRAEGLGQSFSATLMRGMGIVMEYSREPSLEPRDLSETLTSLRIPTFDADKMACGIIPANKLLGTWDIPLRTEEGDPSTDRIISALNDMAVGPKAIDAIVRSTQHWNVGHFWPALTDLLGIWSDWLPSDGCSISSVWSPIGHRVFTMTEVYEARVVWRWYLRDLYSRSSYSMPPVSNQIQKVLGYYDAWETKYPERFYHYFKVLGNDPNETEYWELFKNIFDETTVYFHGLCLKYNTIKVKSERGSLDTGNFYTHLVACHIKVNAHSLDKADERFAAGQGRNDGRVGMGLYDKEFTERAFIYADNVSEVSAEMKSRGFPQSDIDDAWWTMMIRGQAWEMSINRIADKAIRVPSHYYNSPTRVYIL